MAIGYQVKGQWESTDMGQVYYVATAVSKTGRSLGVVRIEVPVMDGFDLGEYYGHDLSRQLIEQAANEQADRFGRAAP